MPSRGCDGQKGLTLWHLNAAWARAWALYWATPPCRHRRQAPSPSPSHRWSPVQTPGNALTTSAGRPGRFHPAARVIQPLTVRRLSSGYYQIIAGERRWRAAKLAGLSEVPVVIIEADDRKVMELGLIENLQREDLNPMEEAGGYRVLMEEYGLTQEEVAQQVGKSPPAPWPTPCGCFPFPPPCIRCWRTASFPPDTPGPFSRSHRPSFRRSWPTRWSPRDSPSARPRPWPNGSRRAKPPPRPVRRAPI